MKRGSQLSVALHALLHMADLQRALTSEDIAKMVGSHAVVVRRTMAGLRDRGIVQSEKGHGGGWRFAKKPKEVSIADVYEALGEPTFVAINVAQDNPRCIVEKAVNHAMGDAIERAEAVFRERLAKVTMEDLAKDARKYRKTHAGGHDHV